MTGAEIIAGVGIAASLLGAGIQYMGSQQAASAKAAQDRYNAQIAANNQTVADNAAKDALARGEVQAQQKANQTAQLIGRQRVALAAGGSDVNYGTAADLQGDTAAAGTLDELTIRNNAMRENVGYTNQGINYGNQAQLDRSAAADTLAGGELAGAASLVSGAGSVARSWYDFSYGPRRMTV